MHTVQLRKPRNHQEAQRQKRNTFSPTEAPLPFRWDISRSANLGSLLEPRGSGSESTYRTTYEGFHEALLSCTARTIALSGDADLVFVGRAPESMYDLLSGLFRDTCWKERLTLLRFSIGHTDTAIARRKCPEVLEAFHNYLDTLGLSPAKLIVRERPVALVDLICNGTTMQQFLQLLHERAVAQKVDWLAVRRKLRVVGIIRRSDEEPPRPFWKGRQDGYLNPRGWKTYSDEIGTFLEPRGLREVAVSSQLWDFLGDWQVKSTPSYSPDEWGTEEASRPTHEAHNLAGLRTARHLFETGCSSETRARFVALLAREDIAMRQEWCRKLVIAVHDL